MSATTMTRQWLELCDEANQAESRYAFERTFQNLRALRKIQKERDKLARKLDQFRAKEAWWCEMLSQQK